FDSSTLLVTPVTVHGGSGDDGLKTGGASDYLDGGPGNDKLDAGWGNDTLDGGVGADDLKCGGGSDTVTYADRVAPVTASSESVDRTAPIDTGTSTGSGAGGSGATGGGSGSPDPTVGGTVIQPPAIVIATLRAILSATGTVAIKLNCPKETFEGCDGTITLQV